MSSFFPCASDIISPPGPPNQKHNLRQNPINPSITTPTSHQHVSSKTTSTSSTKYPATWKSGPLIAGSLSKTGLPIPHPKVFPKPYWRTLCFNTERPGEVAKPEFEQRYRDWYSWHVRHKQEYEMEEALKAACQRSRGRVKT
jgi:hypothetical protein